MSTDPSPSTESATASAAEPSGPATEDRANGRSLNLTQQVYNSPKERAIKYALGACALISVLTTLGIATVLLVESIGFFQEVSLAEFFGDTRWTPQFADQHFGIWPLVAGMLLITMISAVRSASPVPSTSPSTRRGGCAPG